MSNKPKEIIFTGGGSAGHVTPNIALIEKFHEKGWDVNYIGSKNGIEKELISNLGVSYHPISCGKLRRYFSLQNFLDIFKVIYGIFQSIILCYKLKPDVVFSKGGFVSLPVVLAAKILRIPIVIHESDMTVGLTNKICLPLATKVCTTFPDTKNQIKNKEKVVTTGTPIRKDFFAGDAKVGRDVCGFNDDKKIILVFGGSLGAEKINKTIHEILPDILKDFQVVHICGKEKTDESLNYPGYKQFEYLNEKFPHVLAAADMVISRSGANSIYELVIMRKPNILLPLGTKSSRGDQVVNAEYALKKGFSEVIHDLDLSAKSLMDKIKVIEKRSVDMIKAMEEFEKLPTVEMIYDLIVDAIED